MKQFVIIGNSAAGISALEALRKIDHQSKIIVVSDEDYSAYCRCLLPYYLASDIKEEKILYRADSFYKENNIELLLNKKAVRVDPKKNRVILADKSQLDYDCLLIATGASSRFPELKGIKKDGVFGLRSLKDVKDTDSRLPITKSVCVLGGGLVGLKAAYALKKRNVEVKVVIKSGQVLSQLLDLEGAQLVQKKLAENGIEVILGQDITEIISDEGQIKAVKLDSGKALGVSLVIVGKGVSPNIDLVKDTDIKVNEGIIANNNLQSSIPNIYVAGDAAEAFDMTLGEFSINALWTLAVEQGRIAGTNMAGGNINYDGSLRMNSLEFFGLPTVSLGVFRPKHPEEYEEIKIKADNQQIYKKLILKDNRLVGAVLVGDINNSGIFLRLIREKIEVSSFKDRLLAENFGFPDIMNLVKDKEQVYV